MAKVILLDSGFRDQYIFIKGSSDSKKIVARVKLEGLEYSEEVPFEVEVIVKTGKTKGVVLKIISNELDYYDDAGDGGDVGSDGIHTINLCVKEGNMSHVMTYRISYKVNSV